MPWICGGWVLTVWGLSTAGRYSPGDDTREMGREAGIGSGAEHTIDSKRTGRVCRRWRRAQCARKAARESGGEHLLGGDQESTE